MENEKGLVVKIYLAVLWHWEQSFN